MPAISYQNLIACSFIPIFCITSAKTGIFWADHSSYAATLFTLFIFAWRSLSKLVISIPIPIDSEAAFDANFFPTSHVDKSKRDKFRALNSLAGVDTDSSFGIMAQYELQKVSARDVLNDLGNLLLCAECREWVRQVQENEREVTWKEIDGWLRRHGNDVANSEQCRIRPPFRWIRLESKEPLVIDDPDIQNAIAYGQLGAWRIKPASIIQKTLPWAALYSLCFGFQVLFLVLTFHTRLFKYSLTKHGIDYFVPLNHAAPYGLYLRNGTLVDRQATVKDPTIPFQETMLATFVGLGVWLFLVGCSEGIPAHLRNPSSVPRLDPRILRSVSCAVMATYGFMAGLALSFTSGWTIAAKQSAARGFDLQPQFTIALLISGMALGGSFIWRARYGKIGDTRSWPVPPSPPSRYIGWRPLPLFYLRCCSRAFTRRMRQRTNGGNDTSSNTDSRDPQPTTMASSEVVAVSGTPFAATMNPVTAAVPSDSARVVPVSSEANPMTDLSRSTADSASPAMTTASMGPETAMVTCAATTLSVENTPRTVAAAPNPEATTMTNPAATVTVDVPSATAVATSSTPATAALGPSTTALTSPTTTPAALNPTTTTSPAMTAAEKCLSTTAATIPPNPIAALDQVTMRPPIAPDSATINAVEGPSMGPIYGNVDQLDGSDAAVDQGMTAITSPTDTLEAEDPVALMAANPTATMANPVGHSSTTEGDDLTAAATSM